MCGFRNDLLLVDHVNYLPLILLPKPLLKKEHDLN